MSRDSDRGPVTVDGATPLATIHRGHPRPRHLRRRNGICMNTNTALAERQPATDVRDALLIWVASTTVASERSRLASKLSKARSVFGRYAEATQPAVARIVHDLEDLKGQPEHATLIPVPHTFGA